MTKNYFDILMSSSMFDTQIVCPVGFLRVYSHFLKILLEHIIINVESNSECLVALLHELQFSFLHVRL